MIVPPGVTDIQEVQARAHGLVGVAEVREPEGGDWHPMMVRSGTVSLDELGTLRAAEDDLVFDQHLLGQLHNGLV